MALFRVEDILSPLLQIRQRMNDVLVQEIPSSSSHRSRPHTHACRRPFILHRNQWQRLLHTCSRILDHIADVLSSILQAPLEALFSAMASAERSLAECVAPHIHEHAAFDKSPSSRNDPNETHSSAGTADDRLHNDHGDAAAAAAAAADDDDDDDDGGGNDDDVSETANLTEDQLTELQHWMAQKALKHALSMEVPCLHMDNLLTNSIAVHEALSNYSVSNFGADILFHRELAEEILHVEAAEKEQVRISRWWSSGQAEEEDMASAERFFGGQLRKRIGNSSPSIIALAEFVLQRLRDGWDPTTGTAVSATESFARLVLDEAQFSAVIVNGEKVIVGRGAAGTVLLKKWMVDDHMVAVKELEMATEIPELELQQLPEIATQARVRHPNVLPLLCSTQEWRNCDHMATNLDASVHSYGSDPVFSTRKVLGLVMERMFFDLEKLIKLRKDRIHKRHRRSAAGAAIVAAPPPFPLHVAVDIMLQIAKGMEYLHRHHIMHRDLKPANILITPDSVDDDDRRLSFRVKVADFSVSKSGLSIDISSMGHTANVGTGVWRAPEVMRDDEEFEDEVLAGGGTHRNHVDEDTAKYSTKADVYSFAMVCYHILTGKVPFDGDRSRALRRKIQKQQLRPEFDINQMNNCPSMSCPMALVDMIRCCWHPDTSARPHFAHISSFLRYMKICAVQMMQTVNRDIDNHTQRLQQLLGIRLFSNLRSKCMSQRLWEMQVQSRRILLELETVSTSNAATSYHAPEINTATEAVPDVTNRNDNSSAGSSSSSGWTDSNQRGGAGGLIAKIFNAGKSRATDHGDYAVGDVVPAFKYADIIKITENFSTIIGYNGCASIYKGTLANGTHVAVKEFNERSAFDDEVTSLSRAHHQNIVRLIGYCYNENVLIHEYGYGSLLDILYGKLCWRDRLKIIKGVAQGINYLHNHCTPRIIHGNINPYNILIAKDMEAKIRGFGETKILLLGRTTDPEYVNNRKLTRKVDIYCFGILMLQIISRRSALVWVDDGKKSAGFSIDEWVKERLKRNAFSEIVDSKLLKSWNEELSIRNVLNTALTCTDRNSTNRRSIEKIVFQLQMEYQMLVEKSH